MQDGFEYQLWSYLEKTGTLSAEVLAEYREQQQHSWRPLGEILVRGNYLTLHQVSQLLGLQADEPHRRIGELAVREGLLSQAQLEHALAEQRSQASYPLQPMLQDERIDRESLLRALSDHLQRLERMALQPA